MQTNIAGKGRFLAIAACAAALTGACTMANPQPQAQAALAGERQCFNASLVNNFHPLDRDTVHVTVGVNTVYELETVGYCPEIDWTRQIAIRATGGGSWVCHGFDAELLVPTRMGQGVDRCPVTGVRLLSPQEVEAMRAARRR